MGSSESDLKLIDDSATVIGGVIGILGGVAAVLGLVSFFAASGS